MQKSFLFFTIFFLILFLSGCSGSPEPGEGQLPPEAQKAKGTEGGDMPVL
ncbi:MAG TPA: hypothetical protein VNK96_00250 [Fimbriimonadales bacterium]|nr:hypothetical protein [Fimbriimonadales bacterium]